MLRGFVLCIVLLIVLALIGGWFVLQHMDISSLNEPSRFEDYLAIHAKHLLVAREAQQQLPTEQIASADSIEEGHTIYGASCAGCHGYDGRTPTPLGKSLYPHAPSLASPGPQSFTDAEMFVIIRGGIRMSGMPGFGKSQTSDQIWELVQYLRTLPSAPAHH
jgi:mono/diheme cytochrome c family protein